MSRIKPDTPVGLVAKDIYADLYQPIIIIKDGIIKIPLFHDMTTAAIFYKWIDKVNAAFKGKILTKVDKGHQYVAISVSLEEFLNSLPPDLRSITPYFTDPEDINKILDGEMSLRPTEEEFQKLVKKGLISSKRYGEEGEDEGVIKEEETDLEDDEEEEDFEEEGDDDDPNWEEKDDDDESKSEDKDAELPVGTKLKIQKNLNIISDLCDELLSAPLTDEESKKAFKKVIDVTLGKIFDSIK